MTESNDGLLALYKRIILQVRPYWLRLAGVQLIGLLAAPVNLLLPLPLKIVVDNVLGSQAPPSFVLKILPSGIAGSSRMLLAAAVVMLVVFTALNVLQRLASWLLNTST